MSNLNEQGIQTDDPSTNRIGIAFQGTSLCGLDLDCKYQISLVFCCSDFKIINLDATNIYTNSS